MATFDYLPKQLDTVDLTASPFDFVRFDPKGNGPGQQAGAKPVEVAIVGAGDRDVRAQPQGAYWDVLIGMATGNEADLTTLAQTFSPERGLVYLRVDDGDGNQYRVACRTVSLDYQAALMWRAKLRVPNPIMEAVSATSVSDLNNVTHGLFTRSITPGANNNRRAPLSLQYSADAQKIVDPAFDFAYAYRGFIANRSPEALIDYPVDVTDLNGAQNGYGLMATRLNDTSKNCLSNGVPPGVNGASATTIVIDTTAGTWPASGFAYCPTTGEQFYYAAKSATQFTGCVRGVGGTTAANIPDNSQINHTQGLRNLDDFRVFVDQVEVERYIGAANPGGTNGGRIWIPVSCPPRVKLTLRNAMTAGSPGDGGSIEFIEGVADLPDRGLVVIDRELIAYNQRDLARGRILNVLRRAWYQDGVAASHSANAVCYLVNHLFVFAHGRRCSTGDGSAGTWPSGSTALAPPPQPAEHEPAFNYFQSTNAVWDYHRKAAGVQGETNTCFYDQTKPRRMAMWLPDYDVPASDDNNAPGLRVVDMGDDLRWEDADVAAGKPLIPRFRLHVPQGVKAAASGIVYDLVLRRNNRLRILGRDAQGVLQELVDSHSIAESTLSGQTVTPSAILQDVILNGVRGHISSQTYQSSELTNVVAGQEHYQKFTLDTPATIKAIQVMLRGQALSCGAQLYILDASGATPDAGRKLVTYQSQIIAASGSLSWVEFTAGGGLSPKLPAGDYYLYVVAVAGGAGNNLGVGAGFVQARNALLYGKPAGGYLTGTAVCFALIHPGGGPVQPEVQTTQETRQVAFSPGDDKQVKIAANNASGDPYFPLVDRSANEESNIHHAQVAVINAGGAVSNATGYTIDAWMTVGTAYFITVDPESKAVAYIELPSGIFSAWTWFIPQCLTPNDASRWLDLEPGGQNDIKVTEYRRNSIDHVWSYRTRRV